MNFELIKPPKKASRDVAHINGNTPFGLENSGRIAAVSSVARPFKTKKKKWKFFATEKASRVHMAQGSPGQDSQPSLLPDCGSTSNLGRRLGQVNLVINYSLLGKGPETLRARTQILNQNLLKSSIVPISQTSQFCFVK